MPTDCIRKSFEFELEKHFSRAQKTCTNSHKWEFILPLGMYGKKTSKTSNVGFVTEQKVAQLKKVFFFPDNE